MRRRALLAMLATAVVSVIGFGVPLALSVRSFYGDEALLVLSKEAARAAVAVPASFATGTDRPEFPRPAAHVHIALYDASGHKLQGDGPPTADVPVLSALHSEQPPGRDGLVVAVPVSRDELVVGAIRASMPTQVVSVRTRRTWAVMGALAIAVLAAGALLAARLSRNLNLPLVRLHHDAAIVEAGGQVPAWSGSTTAEIDAAHTALSRTANSLKDALARERSFSSEVAHQLRTPLSSLRLRLEAEQYDPDPDASLADDALRDVDRLEQTIHDLLALARDSTDNREPHPLATDIRDAVDRWQPKLDEIGRRMSIQIESQLPWIKARPAAIRQILDVLLDNTITHGSGEVRLSAYRVGEGSVIAISDDGPAIVDANRIFLRRSAEAAGTGIGLPFAKRLAEAEDLRLVLAHPGPGPAFHLVFGGQREPTRPTPAHETRPSGSLHPPEALRPSEP